MGGSACSGRGAAMAVKRMAAVERVRRRDVRGVMGWALWGIRCRVEARPGGPPPGYFWG